MGNGGKLIPKQEGTDHCVTRIFEASLESGKGGKLKQKKRVTLPTARKKGTEAFLGPGEAEPTRIRRPG